MGPGPEPAQVCDCFFKVRLMQGPTFTSLSAGVSGVEGRGCRRAAAQREGLPAEAERRAEGTPSSHPCSRQVPASDRPAASCLQAYLEPLSAALNSGRAILSSSQLQLILAPVASLLELNR